MDPSLFVSVVAHSSLGYGDHVPFGHARLLTGVEALNGLLLVGWSASITYLVMERYWPLHGRVQARRAAKARSPADGERDRDRPILPATGI